MDGPKKDTKVFEGWGISQKFIQSNREGGLLWINLEGGSIQIKMIISCQHKQCFSEAFSVKLYHLHRCRDNKVSDIVFPRNSQFLSVIKDKNNALSLPFVFVQASVVPF